MMNYRANGAVANACLKQYTDLLSQYYDNLNRVLSERCSAVNVKMNVSIINAMASLVDDNVVKVRLKVDILFILVSVRAFSWCDLVNLNVIFVILPYY